MVCKYVIQDLFEGVMCRCRVFVPFFVMMYVCCVFVFDCVLCVLFLFCFCLCLVLCLCCVWLLLCMFVVVVCCYHMLCMFVYVVMCLFSGLCNFVCVCFAFLCLMSVSCMFVLDVCLILAIHHKNVAFVFVFVYLYVLVSLVYEKCTWLCPPHLIACVCISC